MSQLANARRSQGTNAVPIRDCMVPGTRHAQPAHTGAKITPLSQRPVMFRSGWWRERPRRHGVDSAISACRRVRRMNSGEQARHFLGAVINHEKAIPVAGDCFNSIPVRGGLPPAGSDGPRVTHQGCHGLAGLFASCSRRRWPASPPRTDPARRVRVRKCLRLRYWYQGCS